MNDKKYLCTYFDINFLPRGLALFYSVKRYHSDFVFYILALDAMTYEYLNNLNDKQLVLISSEDYNSYFKTSSERFEDKKQYYFSITPGLCLFVLEKYPVIDNLIYLDADVYLFNSLDSLFEEFADNSIGMIEHRLNPVLKLLVKHYGKYNIGVNLFRNDDNTNKCLKEWKNECDSWYPDKPGYPLKFFSDQIFLDKWPEKYKGIKKIENIGVNVVYWNVANYKFSKKDDMFFVNDKPLIIYHFSTLKKLNNNTWNTNSIYGLASITGSLLEIYLRYIKHIESFGLSNLSRVKLNHKETLKKRIAHWVLKRFINETVVVD